MCIINYIQGRPTGCEPADDRAARDKGDAAEDPGQGPAGLAPDQEQRQQDWLSSAPSPVFKCSWKLWFSI